MSVGGNNSHGNTHEFSVEESSSTGWGKIKCPNMKIAMSQKWVNMFAPNVAHLFITKLCINMLLHALFTWSTPNWWKHNFQERILQLNKRNGSASTVQTSLTRTLSCQTAHIWTHLATTCGEPCWISSRSWNRHCRR